MHMKTMASRTVVAPAAIIAVALAACGVNLSYGTSFEALSTPDTTHTNVGAVVRYNAAGNLRQVCPGILVSPTVFVTAGHCTSFPPVASNPLVTFSDTVDNSAVVLHGTAYTDPGFPGTPATYNINDDSHDVGVIVLDQ